MKKFLIIFCCFLISNTYAQNKITLNQAVRLGLENSKELRISRSKIISSHSKIDEINSQFFPQIKLNAAYVRLSDIPPFEIQTPFFSNPIRIQEPILNNYTARLTLHQSLFTGFRLSSLRSAAKYQALASETEYSSRRNEEAFKIITLFWNLYKSEKLLELIEENLKSLEAHLTDTRNFLKNDLVTDHDLLKLEVEYASLQLKQIEAENLVNTIRGNFNKAIGFELNAETKILPENLDAALMNVNFNDLLEEASRNRDDINSFKYNVQSSREHVDAAASNWFPAVSLFSDFTYARPNQRILPARDRFDETWSVGISLNWDLWNWGFNSSQVEIAEQNLLQLEANFEQAMDGIEMELYKNYLDLTAAYKKIEVSNKNLRQSRESKRIIGEKYGVQLATSTDIIDSENSLLKAEIDLISAEIDYELAKIKLEKSAGRKIY
jgi:outer membrane protein